MIMTPTIGSAARAGIPFERKARAAMPPEIANHLRCLDEDSPVHEETTDASRNAARNGSSMKELEYFKKRVLLRSTNAAKKAAVTPRALRTQTYTSASVARAKSAGRIFWVRSVAPKRRKTSADIQMASGGCW
jgi:hypothetical protein